MVLVGLVAVHLLPANTRMTKCDAFPDRRGTVLQFSTAHGIYYSCSGSYMLCSNLLWVKHSSMVGLKDSGKPLGFPRQGFHFRFPREKQSRSRCIRCIVWNLNVQDSCCLLCTFANLNFNPWLFKDLQVKLAREQFVFHNRFCSFCGSFWGCEVFLLHCRKTKSLRIFFWWNGSVENTLFCLCRIRFFNVASLLLSLWPDSPVQSLRNPSPVLIFLKLDPPF